MDFGSQASMAGVMAASDKKISLRILAGERANEMRSALACVVQGIERSNLVGGFASSRRRLPAQDRFARGANFIQAANARRVRRGLHNFRIGGGFVRDRFHRIYKQVALF